ncbi:MAG: hypothetical protein EHM93_19755 [Bacteroidales bacterium]|nr:MAG: hypothetical protein EHM93_19755 [Bacteroidales bacterium]
MIAKQRSKVLTFLLILFFSEACEREPVQNPIIEVGAAIQIISGNNQHEKIGEILSNSVAVQVVDRDQRPIQGVELQFTIISGGGSVSQPKLNSKILGEVSVAWTLGNGPEQVLKVYPVTGTTPEPIYIYANSHISIETKWVKDYSFYAYGVKYNHHNRILESNHFLTFSDGASDDVKIIYSKMAEESFFELKQVFKIINNSDIGFSSEITSCKIKIYTTKHAIYNQIAFPYGFILYGMDSEKYRLWRFDDFLFRKEIKHETTHVLQFLLGLDPSVGPWPDTWFAEGMAEYFSGGAIPPYITTNLLWDRWLEGSDHINPIKIHQFNNFPVPYGRVGEYYPAFSLAVRFLLDTKGLGKSPDDVKAMIKDMLVTRNFATSFEKYMGISVAYYEEHFNELIAEFLRKQ